MISFKDFYEAQIADVEKLKGQIPFIGLRKQGILSPRDPMTQFTSLTAQDLNILWITGMWSGLIPGTGNYPALLKPLGFNINTVKTKAAPVLASLGRAASEFDWAPNFLANRNNQHIAKHAELFRKKADNHAPDIIVGSSQGGAVALSLASEYHNTPMLLICPAWKIFNVTPNYIHPDSIIIHGLYDHDVPIENSEYLSKKFHVPLVVTEDAHIIQKGFWQIPKALSAISKKVLAKGVQ